MSNALTFYATANNTNDARMSHQHIIHTHTHDSSRMEMGLNNNNDSLVDDIPFLTPITASPTSSTMAPTLQESGESAELGPSRQRTKYYSYWSLILHSMLQQRANNDGNYGNYGNYENDPIDADISGLLIMYAALCVMAIIAITMTITWSIYVAYGHGGRYISKDNNNNNNESSHLSHLYLYATFAIVFAAFCPAFILGSLVGMYVASRAAHHTSHITRDR